MTRIVSGAKQTHAVVSANWRALLLCGRLFRPSEATWFISQFLMVKTSFAAHWRVLYVSRAGGVCFAAPPHLMGDMIAQQENPVNPSAASLEGRYKLINYSIY